MGLRHDQLPNKRAAPRAIVGEPFAVEVAIRPGHGVHRHAQFKRQRPHGGQSVPGLQPARADGMPDAVDDLVMDGRRTIALHQGNLESHGLYHCAAAMVHIDGESAPSSRGYGVDVDRFSALVASAKTGLSNTGSSIPSVTLGRLVQDPLEHRHKPRVRGQPVFWTPFDTQSGPVARFAVVTSGYLQLGGCGARLSGVTMTPAAERGHRLRAVTG